MEAAARCCCTGIAKDCSLFRLIILNISKLLTVYIVISYAKSLTTNAPDRIVLGLFIV